MKKSELKNRMVVKIRNGEKGIIMDDYIMFEKTYMQLSCQYNEDLTCVCDNSKMFDIIEVFGCTCTLDYLFFNINDLELIWKRI